MAKVPLTPETVIAVGNQPTADDLRVFFQGILGFLYDDYAITLEHKQFWPRNKGKTLEQIIDNILRSPINYTAADDDTNNLPHEIFSIITSAQRAFILEFNNKMNELGYDYGGKVGGPSYECKYVLIYGKTNTKSRPITARVYISNRFIAVRFYFKDVDKHREYIENAPKYIKSAFAFKDGDCKNCSINCKKMHNYTIDGVAYSKCPWSTFFFRYCTLDMLEDYMALYSKFSEK
ncbi:MAG: hypothetical protein FWC95_07890 [Defluviitaleaceae bacterium]|nr:hypothetical protein [Defluviitaleaceae bacterium]